MSFKPAVKCKLQEVKAQFRGLFTWDDGVTRLQMKNEIPCHETGPKYPKVSICHQFVLLWFCWGCLFILRVPISASHSSPITVSNCNVKGGLSFESYLFYWISNTACSSLGWYLRYLECLLQHRECVLQYGVCGTLPQIGNVREKKWFCIKV